MTQKDEILELLKDGESYDRIEQTTGANRAYIRQIASDHRQRDKKDEVSDKVEEPEDTEGSQTSDNKDGKKMTGETLEFEGKPEKKWDDGAGKSGLDHHKEWVAAKKYECQCGCTLNSKGDFCPHCGTSLDWGGING